MNVNDVVRVKNLTYTVWWPFLSQSVCNISPVNLFLRLQTPAENCEACKKKQKKKPNFPTGISKSVHHHWQYVSPEKNKNQFGIVLWIKIVLFASNYPLNPCWETIDNDKLALEKWTWKCYPHGLNSEKYRIWRNDTRTTSHWGRMNSLLQLTQELCVGVM